MRTRPGSPPWLLVAAGLLLAVGVHRCCVSNRDCRGATPLSILLAGVSSTTPAASGGSRVERSGCLHWLATTAVLLSSYWSALAAVSVSEGVSVGYTDELTRLFVAHALSVFVIEAVFAVDSIGSLFYNAV